MRLVVKVGPLSIIDHHIAPEADTVVTVTYGRWWHWWQPGRVRLRIQQGNKVTHAIDKPTR
jgi:hypothetical protein